jgi:hypothetical protein
MRSITTTGIGCFCSLIFSPSSLSKSPEQDLIVGRDAKAIGQQLLASSTFTESQFIGSGN